MSYVLVVSGVTYPYDFPHWMSVYTQFRRWKKQDLIKRINNELIKDIRIKLGRKDNPSAGVVDSQWPCCTNRELNKLSLFPDFSLCSTHRDWSANF
jgi:transposase